MTSQTYRTDDGHLAQEHDQVVLESTLMEPNADHAEQEPSMARPDADPAEAEAAPGRAGR